MLNALGLSFQIVLYCIQYTVFVYCICICVYAYAYILLSLHVCIQYIVCRIFDIGERIVPSAGHMSSNAGAVPEDALQVPNGGAAMAHIVLTPAHNPVTPKFATASAETTDQAETGGSFHLEVAKLVQSMIAMAVETLTGHCR
jgi:hypothetical protein